MHLDYCLLTAAMKDKENRHPKQVMRDLGITCQHSTPQSMGDCWWFWNCENVPDNLPSAISEVSRDPMECIGYGLSQEDAEKIRDYSK